MLAEIRKDHAASGFVSLKGGRRYFVGRKMNSLLCQKQFNQCPHAAGMGIEGVGRIRFFGFRSYVKAYFTRGGVEPGVEC